MLCATIQTCEGDVCRQCKVNILHCRCASQPLRHYRAKSAMNEQITGQGWVPQTELPRNAGEGEV